MADNGLKYTFQYLPWQTRKWNGQMFVPASGVASAGMVRTEKLGNTNPHYNEIRSLGYFLPPLGYLFERFQFKGWVGSSRRFVPDANPSYTIDDFYSGSRPNFVGGYSLSNEQYIIATEDEIKAAHRQAKQRLFSAIKDQKINLGILLAERGRTIDLFISTFNRIHSGIRAFRSGRFGYILSQIGNKTPKQTARWMRRNRSKAERKAASAWLELQYGWRPLLNDIYGACSELATMDAGQRAVKAVGSATFRYTKQTVLKYGYGADPFAGAITINTNGTCTIKYTTYFRIDVPASSALAVLGLTNPATILWEVTPFSFVVDWFLPVGSWINNFDATMGVHFVDGAMTEFFRQSSSLSDVLQYSNSASQESVIGNASATCETVRLNREKLFEFPDLPLPSVKSPISFLHIVNSVALLITTRRK